MQIGKIYKYTRPPAGHIELELPQGAELLHVADQVGLGRQLDFWALVDPDAAPEEVRRLQVLVTGTGEPEPGFAHWQTVVTAGGGLVLHVFLDHNGARSVPTF